MVPHFYWARVVENVDPDGLNRVRVAKEREEANVTEWIPVVTQYGNSDTGLSFLPDIGDQVLVVSLDAFDTQKAVLGSVWSNDVVPPQTKENSAADMNGNGENTLRFFRSRAGNLLIFDDTDGAEKLQLIAADSKSRFEFSDADELVSLMTEHDLAVSSEGEVSIQAEEVDITSQRQVNISADEYQVEAKSDAKMDAGDGMDIKGSGVALN